ncbi:MAG: DNA cytosine methyltransferase [Candidatus Nanopelagicaceae bacterium]|nr:DNA cytosine methyltransferase [Candidatus Nanopelagicaceae bacterium]
MNEPYSIPNVMSVWEASVLLKFSEQRVRGLATEGQILGSKVGGTWVLNEESVRSLALQRGVLNPEPSGQTRNHGKQKLNVLSFFSGAMGLDLGLEAAGLKTILACEFDKWSRATITANRPEVPLLGDIWNCTAESVRIAAGLNQDDEIDVIAGGPPCQAFSTAGNRQGFEDIRGNVFLHFIDLAMELKPKYLVLENVRGLLSAALKHRPISERGKGFAELADEEQAGGALKHIVQKIRDHGYSVSFNLYNAANFGAPQTRERVILICARDGSQVPHLSPTNSDNPGFGLPKWKTFKEACGDIQKNHHDYIKFPEDRLKYYRLLGPGQYWKHLPEELQKEALGNSYFSGGGKTGFFRRLAWDKPSPTLVTHPAMPATDLGHPIEPRPLSIQEYKRIQSFPDSWVLQGPLAQQYKQVGNAVPIPLGKSVGLRILAHFQNVELPIPDGFKFSRYKGTSESEFLQNEDVLKEPTLF